MLPNWSRAVTWTAGVSAAPAVAVLGCPVKPSWVAGPGVAVAVRATGLPARPGAVAVSVLGPASVPSSQPSSTASPLLLVLTGV